MNAQTGRDPTSSNGHFGSDRPNTSSCVGYLRTPRVAIAQKCLTGRSAYQCFPRHRRPHTQCPALLGILLVDLPRGSSGTPDGIQSQPFNCSNRVDRLLL